MSYNTKKRIVMNAKSGSGMEHNEDLVEADATNREHFDRIESDARDSADACMPLMSDYQMDTCNNDNVTRGKSTPLREKAEEGDGVHHDIPNTRCLAEDPSTSQFNDVKMEGPESGIPMTVDTEDDVSGIPRTVNAADHLSDNPKYFNLDSDVSGFHKTVNTEVDVSAITRTVNTEGDVSGITRNVNTEGDVSGITRNVNTEVDVSGITRNMEGDISGISRNVNMEKDVSAMPTHGTTVQDRGWAWVVMLACFIVHVILDGIYFSVGVVFVELLDYFGESKRDTAVIVSLCFGVGFLLGPLYAYLSDRFGCRLVVIAGALISSAAYVLSIFAPNVYFMYLTFGLMAGFGYGCVYLPSILAINYYFNERRAFALGIGTCGSGVGVLIFGPITKQLIHLYSWKGTVLIHAGILLNLVACGLVYLPNDEKTEGDEETNDVAVKKSLQPEQDMINENSFIDEYLPLSTDINEGVVTSYINEDIAIGELNTGNHDTGDYDKTAVLSLLKNRPDVSVLRNRPYVLYVIATFLTSTVYVTPFVFIPDKAKDDGIDDFKASWLVSTLGMSGLAGRFLSGVISNIRGVNRVFLNIGCMVGCGTCIASLAICATVESLFASCVGIGLTLGSTVPLSPVLVMDFVGKDNMSKAYGIINFAWGAAHLLGPPVIGVEYIKTGYALGFTSITSTFIVGWLYDISGSYDVSFLAAGIVFASGGLVLSLVPLCRYSYRSSNRK